MADGKAKTACRNLLSTNHFHIDWQGRFIPPGCTGLVIPLDEAVNGIPSGKYPAWEALITGGVDKLQTLAESRGSEAEYSSPCAKCFYIRQWLADHAGDDFPELDKAYYAESLKFYK